MREKGNYSFDTSKHTIKINSFSFLVSNCQLKENYGGPIINGKKAISLCEGCLLITV